ncbi:hypothetical protein Acr_25g0000310 [Actinidia rufa]|uniref:Uncharacterized protein n=1 Tax=Actinidia rufa TaxID=165716 RepID=A0A7J0GXU7_9ERIC|nr:hypothetical protein Acr_25g0000310 [Actinidia rufa]
MLPNGVANLTTKGLEEFWDLLVMQQVQRVTAISDYTKYQSSELKKSKKKVINLDLAIVVEAQDANYVAATQAHNEAAL